MFTLSIILLVLSNALYIPFNLKFWGAKTTIIVVIATLLFWLCFYYLFPYQWLYILVSVCFAISGASYFVFKKYTNDLNN